MYKKHSSSSFLALLCMPRLSEHKRSGIIGMLKAGVNILCYESISRNGIPYSSSCGLPYESK